MILLRLILLSACLGFVSFDGEVYLNDTNTLDRSHEAIPLSIHIQQEKEKLKSLSELWVKIPKTISWEIFSFVFPLNFCFVMGQRRWLSGPRYFARPPPRLIS